VRPVLAYVSEAWETREAGERRLSTWEIKFMKRITAYT
jgi:hypothetical protein